MATWTHPAATVCPQPIIPQEATTSWYALMTRSRNERVVVTRLGEWGFESYLPVISEIHRWKDRKKRVELPLFSCYVFVRMNMTNELRYRASNVDGVFGFVGPQGKPLSIPDEQIESIRTLLNGQHAWSNHSFLKIGQRVRIRGGALDGIEGVLQACSGEQRLIISIDAIQRSLSVRVDGYQVEPI